MNADETRFECVGFEEVAGQKSRQSYIQNRQNLRLNEKLVAD